MSDYQYCKCGKGLTPTKTEVIEGFIDCTCGLQNKIIDAEEMKKDLLKQLVDDVEYLMNRTRFMI